ncbi:hypothetical protein FB45DRAFT_875686 [Roridomyces roridus]|uniref:Uncharacterized protein n=1 Tax=Roridomyces roridus TaxID=1738132 RepID=A0AAD7B5Z2_9AGAR|nr:hypothetical protein FB45DRAFT_875686 [Roridomyces roridus]
MAYATGASTALSQTLRFPTLPDTARPPRPTNLQSQAGIRRRGTSDSRHGGFVRVRPQISAPTIGCQSKTLPFPHHHLPDVPAQQTGVELACWHLRRSEGSRQPSGKTSFVSQDRRDADSQGWVGSAALRRKCEAERGRVMLSQKSAKSIADATVTIGLRTRTVTPTRARPVDLGSDMLTGRFGIKNGHHASVKLQPTRMISYTMRTLGSARMTQKSHQVVVNDANVLSSLAAIKNPEWGTVRESSKSNLRGSLKL